MTSSLILQWIFRSILGSGAVAFIAFIVVLQLRPQRTFRYCSLCFGWLLFCVGTLFIMGAWQEGERHGGWQWSDWRVLPGLGLWAGGLILGRILWFADPPPSIAQQQSLLDEGYRACQKHARWIAMLSLLGFIGAVACLFSGLQWPGPDWLKPRATIIVFIAGQLPAAALTFVFLPRCHSCQGRMKIASWRPASYLCKNCGKRQQTNIDIANSHSHSTD